jgi:hypothetical protein
MPLNWAKFVEDRAMHETSENIRNARSILIGSFATKGVGGPIPRNPPLGFANVSCLILFKRVFRRYTDRSDKHFLTEDIYCCNILL